MSGSGEKSGFQGLDPHKNDLSPAIGMQKDGLLAGQPSRTSSNSCPVLPRGGHSENGMNDQELLRQYANDGSEAAFAELVRRHLNLVYSVAMRQLNDASAAQEVAQAVFCLLARKAGQLRDQAVPGAWLYLTACHKSREHRRAEKRRRHREQEAATMQELNVQDNEQNTWQLLAPLLDDAMESLGEGERQAVILRFFEQRPFREIGEVLGLEEDGARKRVDRALHKLRAHLCRCGVTISAAAITTAITSRAVQAAPAGLATTVATAATLSNAALHSSASASVKAIAMTTLQKPFVVTAIVLATATVVFQWKEIHQLHTDAAGLRSTAERATRLQEENDRLRREAEEQSQEVETELSELLRLRNRTAQLAGELQRYKATSATNSVGNATTASVSEAGQTNEPFFISVTNRVSNGQMLVAGGWSRQQGRRTYFLTTPTIGAGTNPSNVNTVLLKSYVVEAPDAVWDRLGWGTVKSDTRQSTSVWGFAPDQTAEVMKTLRKTKGVDFLSSPTISVLDGQQGTLAVNYQTQYTDGQEFNEPFTVQITPRVAPDGGSLDLELNAQLPAMAMRSDVLLLPDASPPPDARKQPDEYNRPRARN